MVRLREIPRTATFAWSPGAATPLIATGTRAGAVDADFSNETCLELWDLGLGRQDASADLYPVGKISTDSGFNDLAWTESEDSSSRGVIAGALENGSLDLWDADKLLRSASDSVISRTTKHSGAIKALQFNPKHPNLLATGGTKGELYISDLHNVENPFRLGGNAARADDIECLDWNKRVAHILVTGSNAGFVTVWDVKTKKESLTLNNMGRKAVSAVAWDPEKPTKLVTSTPLESDPMIYVWDLRNSHAPERTLRGHEAGVLSLSWCSQDPDLLLSSGKDNRTLCWNPQTGHPYGEFPVVTNWTFQTRWNPHNPNFFATASFDGRISVQTVQNTRTETSQAIDNQNQALDGEDFFAKAQTQPQVSSFSLPKAPKWLERPCGASFGFGGRIVSIGLSEQGKRSSTIKITPFEVDESVGKATETFETALKEGDLRSICEARAASAPSDEEKSDWKVIEALLSENPRKGLVEYLGFQDRSADEAADSLAQLGLNKEQPEAEQPPEKKSEKEKPSRGVKKHKRLQSMFETNPEAESFLSDIAASKGAKTNNPFQIFNGSESEAEKGITTALLLGDFEKALDVALKENRMSDAFMIAICGGQKCVEKAQEHYFTKQHDGPNYIRLLASIVGKNLWDVVHNADLSNWKETMAALCTFADAKDFPDLCDALGDRLEEVSRASDDKTIRKDASLCFLAGSKLEKVVGIWTQELSENEQKGIETAADSSSFSVHVRALQGLIEKVTIFRQVTNFQDTERTKESDWKLSNLYDKYIEYADVVATHGRLQIAQQYLDLVPEKHPEAEIAKNRIQLAMRQAAPRRGQAAAAAGGRISTRSLPQPSAYQPQSPFAPAPAAQNPYAAGPAAAAAASASPYAPAVAAPPNPYSPTAAVNPQASNPYAPAASGPYAPTGYQPTATPPYGAPSQPPLGSGGAVPPPPRASSGQSGPPPVSTYTTATNLPAWNDLPEDFMKPASRRGTPATGANAISAPFPNQPSAFGAGPPPVGPPSAQRPPSVPPPPKGPAPPPRMTSPPQAVPPPSMTSPPPPQANMYASLPQSPPLGAAATASIPRGASPYNPPPSMPPPPSRYAPSPAAPSPQLQNRVPAPPPAQAIPPPAAAPAVPPPAQAAPPPVASNPYVANTSAAAVPPPSPMHNTSQSVSSRPSTASSQKKATPAPSKYPPGDRSHIPSDAMPIYEILSGDMQRIKSRAPSSFKAQVEDAERRLSILFDHLNNEDLLKSNTISDMVQLSHAIQNRDYETARTIHVDIMTNRTEECGNWMVGVKRLISMSRATP